MATIITDNSAFDTAKSLTTETLVDLLYALMALGVIVGLGYAAMMETTMAIGMVVMLIGVWGVGTLYWSKAQRYFR